MLFLRQLLAAVCGLGCSAFAATPVKLEAVAATTSEQSHFAEAVDGILSPANGWQVPRSTEHAGVFRCVPAMAAGRVRFIFSFHGAGKNSYFSEFSISTTSDPNPSLESRWVPLFLTGWDANQGWVGEARPNVRMLGETSKSDLQLDGLISQEHITGVRIQSWVLPSARPGAAVLTELKMERMPMGTTNVALGCPVTASHALAPNQQPEFLTDGLVGSFAYPDGVRGPEFYFEVDLRHVREFDHITLRGRSEASAMNRFTNLRLDLYDEMPGENVPALWTWVEERAGEVQEPGEVKVVRGADGEGTFRGRWLRISKTVTISHTPQIAEVEVYDSVVPQDLKVLADDLVLPQGDPVRVPPEVRRLGFSTVQPELPDGLVLERRWRLAGMGDKWLPAPNTGLIESFGLPAGEYLFEAQVRHSDREWNSASLRVPLTVLAPWWENPWARLAVALAAVGIVALLAWNFSRRRLARQLAEMERSQELSRERARIARDMHDVVGARLTQLTVMHELFARKESLTQTTRARLQELGATARDAVGALDEAVWAVNPRNDTLQNLADYLCHAASSYLRPLDIRLRQQVPVTWPEREVGAQKRHQLLLAFKEGLQNVVKHAGATTVTLILRFEDPVLVVCLDDNGCGLPKDTDGVEKDGLDNMGARLAAVGGVCIAKTLAEGGTRVEFRLPI